MAVLVLTGCSTSSGRSTAWASALKPGMTQAQVIEVAEKPDTMHVDAGRRVTWVYGGSVRVRWGADGRVEAVETGP